MTERDQETYDMLDIELNIVLETLHVYNPKYAGKASCERHRFTLDINIPGSRFHAAVVIREQVCKHCKHE